MREDFLHYLWKFQLFTGRLVTHDGLMVEVVRPGQQNSNSGPDFTDALLRIGDTLWAGSVEMHLNASAWRDHGHHQDAAYDSVILHVVLNNNRQAVRTNGSVVATAECSHYIDEMMYGRYRQLMESRLWIACAHTLSSCPPVVQHSWFDNLVVERLIYKSADMEQRLTATRADWEEVLYCFIARAFGLELNVLPMDLLARSLPYKILQRHRDHPLQAEALLFGQAGFLQGQARGEYQKKLQDEYTFLKHKYGLTPVDKSLWKFMRMRPAAFPTTRLAILAGLLTQPESLVSMMLEADTLTQLEKLLSIEANPFWNTHYSFEKASPDRGPVHLGVPTIHVILINTVIPLLFLYGRHHGLQHLIDRAIGFLYALPPESNHIVRKWAALGIKACDAATSQALIHLKKHYCDARRCLLCRIGNEMLRG